MGLKLRLPKIDLGKKLGLTKLERELRTTAKTLGLHDDIVALFRNSGELAVRATLSSLPQSAVDEIVAKLQQLAK